MNRYLFIGSLHYSAECLKALLDMRVNIVGIMCPYREACSFNSDYTDLSVVAEKYGKDVYYFKRLKDEKDYINRCKPDIIFIFGLSQLVPKDILNIPSIGCIGSHPALLPENRGRHPIIWSIINGLHKSGITLFWLDDGMDSGDIWAQREFDINPEDTAQTVYIKVTDLTIELLRNKITELEKGAMIRMPQNHTRATYLRKRTKEDGEIKWQMPAKRIYDIVRALTNPYPGAHCIFKGEEIKIWKTKIAGDGHGFDNCNPGMVIKSTGDRITVKTGDGLIEIIDHGFKILPKAGDLL
jgi:methionyl-tRNA formyltransferase